MDFFTADKEVSTMKGAKVNVFFSPKTEGQKTDQQFFFKETLPRLEQRLKDVLTEKKGLKWNLVYHCTLSMPSKYRSEPMVYSPHFRTPHAITSTYPQQLREQLDAAMEVLEERLSVFALSNLPALLCSSHNHGGSGNKVHTIGQEGRR